MLTLLILKRVSFLPTQTFCGILIELFRLCLRRHTIRVSWMALLLDLFLRWSQILPNKRVQILDERFVAIFTGVTHPTWRSTLIAKIENSFFASYWRMIVLRTLWLIKPFHSVPFGITLLGNVSSRNPKLGFLRTLTWRSLVIVGRSFWWKLSWNLIVVDGPVLPIVIITTIIYRVPWFR